jgi:hypothetical protein
MVLRSVFQNLRNTNSATNWDCISEGKRIASGSSELNVKRKGTEDEEIDKKPAQVN